MAEISSLFATKVYRAPLGGAASLRADLEAACLVIAADDGAGQAWSRKNAYPGYTSYASLNDLPWRFPPFATLQTRLDKHAAAFAKELSFDLLGGSLALDSLWVNVLSPDGAHTGHIHPNSVISGTYYVSVPKGASALKLEDPRLPMMMAAPPRKARAPEDMKPFVYVAPSEGDVLMWESWLRHEVTPNGADEPRISVSFNYRWERE